MPQLNLAFLVAGSTSAALPPTDRERELRAAVTDCPDNPTALWLEGQWQSLAAVDVLDATDPLGNVEVTTAQALSTHIQPGRRYAHSMLGLLSDLMGVLPGRCTYGDARWVSRRAESIRLRDGQLEQVDDERFEGVGVRVRVDGAWGYAATRELTATGLREALARAIALAQAQPPAGRHPLAALATPAQGHWKGSWEIDPFGVSLTDKVQLLSAAEAAMRCDPRIVRSEAECVSLHTDMAFCSSEGAACSQTLVECGGAISAVAADDVELQVRSFPNAHGGSVAAAGWEHLLGLDLAAAAPRIGEEAVALLSAPPCPSGRTNLILHDEQVALQVHESIGHALELDRILLQEASYAGTSWVTPADLGRLRYGSSVLNVTADATIPGALGTFGWDDEGVAATRTPLIVDGILHNALSDRTSAGALGLERSGGCGRADGFARQPIVRMTNVSLEAGDAGSLADLIAATDEGLYLETNRSWSIDDRRLNFQFSTEVAREICDGQLGRMYRNASYAGITPQFWGSLDAVCSAPAWRMWGLLNCGKGEPGQVAHVSHGAAPARFRDVEVGVA